MDTCKIHSVYVYGVEGIHGRCNDVLFRPSLSAICGDTTPQKTLVYFGCDVQNFFRFMDWHNEDIAFCSYCLETTAKQLSENFPDHHIVVIKPSRTVFEHVSCYDNFVMGNVIGMPKHLYCYSAIPHLEMLLRKISRKIRLMDAETLFEVLFEPYWAFEETHLTKPVPKRVPKEYKDGSPEKILRDKIRSQLLKWQVGIRLNIYPITMIGFGKGCVVLNQFLYEFHYAKRLEPKNQDSKFIDYIKSMYWLDPGHPGRDNVYVTSRAVLRTLTDLGIMVHNHLTTQQIEDLKRPWIRKQWIQFANVLANFSAKRLIFLYNVDEGYLASHFQVLHGFMGGEEFDDAMRFAYLPEDTSDRPGKRSNRKTSKQICRDIMTYKNVLGIALIKPNYNPYFEVQVIMRPRPDAVQSNPHASNDIESHSLRHTAFADPPSTRDPFTLVVKKVKADLISVAPQNCRIRKPYKIKSSIKIAIPNESRTHPGVHVFKVAKEMYMPTLKSSGGYFSAAQANNQPAASAQASEAAPEEVQSGDAPMQVPAQDVVDVPSQTVALPAQPASNADEPASNAVQPASNANEPASNADEPASNANEPASNANEPASNADEPAISPRAARQARRSQRRNGVIPYSLYGRAKRYRYNLRSMR